MRLVYSCIFHPCILTVSHFPLPHFQRRHRNCVKLSARQRSTEQANGEEGEDLRRVYDECNKINSHGRIIVTVAVRSSVVALLWWKPNRNLSLCVMSTAYHDRTHWSSVSWVATPFLRPVRRRRVWAARWAAPHSVALLIYCCRAPAVRDALWRSDRMGWRTVRRYVLN